ncbi:MAG: aminotransferase class I/II-fold pyridoxal phosphate-dependent enzyme [Gemmatimonadetes bacterium]|nr:aminotransferase class I/II-fold pyridoxal phosphate-dependent enzyme [Gemmatimonadota bacterium]
MSFEPFAMERWQSTWEHRVRFNLSESGVHPMRAHELLALAGAAAEPILDLALGYPQSNGSERLRAAIAAYYPGATLDHVLVTNGSAEANYLNCWRLIEPGDGVAIMLPSYMQTWGLARAFGAEVRPFRLREENGWQPDLAEIDAAIAAGTRLVIVTNPNNPTGAALSAEARNRIVARADAAGAWILSDEVYQGAERTGVLTPSLWGRSEHVIVTNGLSKAYGLPGLRIGWCVAPAAHVADLWARKDYTTIGPTVMSDALAALALAPATRGKIFERTRAIIRSNWNVLERWMSGMDGEFTYRPPDAGAICYARYRSTANSSALAEVLRRDHDVLIVPGDQFGMDRFVRLGFGLAAQDLEAALARVALAFRQVGD